MIGGPRIRFGGVVFDAVLILFDFLMYFCGGRFEKRPYRKFPYRKFPYRWFPYRWFRFPGIR